MKTTGTLLLTLLAFIAASCADRQNTPVPPSGTASPVPVWTASPSPSSPAATPSPTPEHPAASPSPTETPAPKWIQQLCSPLAEQALAEIPEIVSDPYNPPPPGRDERHHGVDFAYYRRKDRITNEGEIVQAILPGRAAAVVKNQLPYGNMVILETEGSRLPPVLRADLGIRPGESLYHLYAHFGAAPLVVFGDEIACGQPLGAVGASGYNIVNPHLHLETRIGPAGMSFPAGLGFYTTAASDDERENYLLWRTSGVFRHFDPMRLILFYLGE